MEEKLIEGPEIVVVNTVSLLGACRPAALDQLKRDFPDPDSRAVLMPEGHVLGATELVLAGAVSRTLLTEIDSICLDAVLAVRRKLATANLLEFLGKVIAASSTASLVGYYYMPPADQGLQTRRSGLASLRLSPRRCLWQ